jgi:hypothetical protein
MAPDTLQSLGGLGLKVRIDDDTANPLLVDPFALNAKVVIRVDPAARRECKFGDLVEGIFERYTLALLLNVVIIVVGYRIFSWGGAGRRKRGG